MTPLQILGSSIREWRCGTRRHGAKISEEALALYLGISRTTLNCIERGVRWPKPEHLAALRALGWHRPAASAVRGEGRRDRPGTLRNARAA